MSARKMYATDYDETRYDGHGQTEEEARAYASLAQVLDEVEPCHMDALTVQLERSDETQAQHEGIEHLRDLLLHHGWEPPRIHDYNRVLPRPTMQDDDQFDWSEVMSLAAEPRA